MFYRRKRIFEGKFIKARTVAKTKERSFWLYELLQGVSKRHALLRLPNFTLNVISRKFRIKLCKNNLNIRLYFVMEVHTAM